MTGRGRKSKGNTKLSESGAVSERKTTLRSSQKTKMSTPSSKESKSQFDELKEMLKKQNEYMETEFREVKEKVNQTDDKISAITENLTGVQNQVGQLFEKQSSADERISTLEARLTESDQIYKMMEEKLSKHQASIDELSEKATVNEEAMKRLKFLEEFRLKSLKKDEDSEQHHRKMNLWVYGLEEIDNKEDTWQRIRWFLNEVLEIEQSVVDSMDIKNTHRVGDKKKTKGIRPIIIAFLKWPERILVLKSSKILAQYNHANKTKLAVKTDLAPIARQTRKCYQAVANKINENKEGLARACDDGKGKVWLERRPKADVDWEKQAKVPEKYKHLLNNDPYGTN